jgi:hypothetical protein
VKVAETHSGHESGVITHHIRKSGLGGQDGSTLGEARPQLRRDAWRVQGSTVLQLEVGHLGHLGSLTREGRPADLDCAPRGLVLGGCGPYTGLANARCLVVIRHRTSASRLSS